MLNGWLTSVISLAALTTVARAQCPSGESPFHARGMDGDVRALATFDDGNGPALYAAGGFLHADGVASSCIARWNGASWSPLGGGVNGQVTTLAVFDDGNGPALYVGGAFMSAGGVAAHGIARWDGASWSSLGGGIDGAYGYVNAMKVFDDGTGAALYVTGNFDFAGATLASHIAKWNGTNWSSLSSGLSYTNGLIPFGTSLEVFDDGHGPALCLGGAFDHAGTTAAKCVAKWSGGAWSALGVGVGDFYDQVWSLCSFDDGGGSRLYAGGVFSSAGGLPAISVALWNGSTWSTVGAGLRLTSNQDPYVYSLNVLDVGSGPALYAGGKFNVSGSTALANIARWNGTSWSNVAGGFGNTNSQAEVRAMEAFDDGAGPVLFAGGKFDRAGNVHAKSIAALRAGTWTELSDGQGLGGSAVFALISHATLGGGPAIYVGGSITASGPPLAQDGCVRRWDGAQWSGIGITANGFARAFAIHDDGSGESLFVGGAFLEAGGVPVSHIAKWNGSTWAPLGSGLNGTVNALLEYDDGSGPVLIAGGDFASAGGAPAAKIARWDGATWTPLGSGLTGGDHPQVYALAVFGSGASSQLYAAGHFLVAGGMSAHNIARWNGLNWSAVGNSGVSGSVWDTAFALTVFDDGSGPALYAGGSFKFADSLTVNNIAKWNGASWSGLSTGMDNDGVRALHVHDNGSGARLYAAGRFFHAGGLLARSIAAWDGANWSALGSGVNSYPEWVYALATFADPARPWPALYVGGQFTTFDGFDSQLIARWSDPCVGQATSYCTAGTTKNGCTANMSASGAASASAASGFVVSVVDVEGAKSGTMFFSTSGSLAAPWGNGTSVLCVAQPVVRTGVQNGVGASGTCEGVYSQDFNTWMQANPTRAPAPGSTVRMQTWFRDPGNGSNQTTSLSDALSFVVTP